MRNLEISHPKHDFEGVRSRKATRPTFCALVLKINTMVYSPVKLPCSADNSTLEELTRPETFDPQTAALTYRGMTRVLTLNLTYDACTTCCFVVVVVVVVAI